MGYYIFGISRLSFPQPQPGIRRYPFHPCHIFSAFNRSKWETARCPYASKRSSSPPRPQPSDMSPGRGIFRGCSALVIRCFKRVEHFADWITGAAGPVFVALCWSLIGLGGVAFCELILQAALSIWEAMVTHPSNLERSCLNSS